MKLSLAILSLAAFAPLAHADSVGGIACRLGYSASPGCLIASVPGQPTPNALVKAQAPKKVVRIIGR